MERIPFQVISFGLMNAPSMFQRMMDDVLKWLDFVRVYLDAVVIFFKTFEEHMKCFKVFIEGIAEPGLMIKAPKCSFVQQSVELLSPIVDGSCVHVDSKKVKMIKELHRPNNATELRSFLGIDVY